MLDLVQMETGKARVHAFEEVARRRAGGAALRARARPACSPSSAAPALVPLLTAAPRCASRTGVVGIIAPWNYPLTLAITDALPALVAGNAVVLKPDAQTPLTALWAADLLERGGAAGRPGAGRHWAGAERRRGRHGHRRLHVFTGSTAIGREVARQAGERLVGVTLELGGKNALLVPRTPTWTARWRARCAPASPTPASCASRSSGCSSHRDVRERFPDAVPAAGAGAAAGDRAGLRLRRGLAGLRRPAGDGERARRRRGGPGARPWSAVTRCPTSARCSTSRPCWPASPRRWRATARRRSGRSWR